MLQFVCVCVGLLCVSLPSDQMDSSGAAADGPPWDLVEGPMFVDTCVQWPEAGFVSAEVTKRESVSLDYLSDILHVRPGVLLQQKELVPHPSSFGAPEWDSIGVLSCQPCGPPPPPCSPSQGPETVPWRAEVDHGPQHHQKASFPPLHDDTTTALCLLPTSVVCLLWFWSEYQISPHAAS